MSIPTNNDVLPNEVLGIVFQYLGPIDLASASEACRKWRFIANNDSLWRTIVEKALPDVSKHDQVTWKTHYAQNVHRQKITDLCTLEHQLISAEGTSLSIWDKDHSIRQNFPNRSITVTDHQAAITCMRVKMIGLVTFLLTGSDDHMVKVWKKKSNHFELIHTLRSHTDSVQAVQIMNQKVISGSKDHTIKIWDIDHGRCEQTLLGHTGSITALCPLPQRDNILVSASADKTIRVWEVLRLRSYCRQILRGHTEAITCLAYSLNTRTLHSGSLDGTIRIWESESVSSFLPTDCIQAHVGRVTALYLSNTGFHSAGEDGFIKIRRKRKQDDQWDAKQYRPELDHPIVSMKAKYRFTYTPVRQFYFVSGRKISIFSPSAAESDQNPINHVVDLDTHAGAGRSATAE